MKSLTGDPELTIETWTMPLSKWSRIFRSASPREMRDRFNAGWNHTDVVFGRYKGRPTKPLYLQIGNTRHTCSKWARMTNQSQVALARKINKDRLPVVKAIFG
ncbi:MAG: hypothetical protein AAFN70_14835 [Planctomycetota bacterium]